VLWCGVAGSSEMASASWLSLGLLVSKRMEASGVRLEGSGEQRLEEKGASGSFPAEHWGRR